MVGVAIAGVASAITTAMHYLTHRHHEIKSHREMCNHQWGEPYSLYHEGRFWQVRCKACGYYKNINEDGSDYVPGQEGK